MQHDCGNDSASRRIVCCWDEDNSFANAYLGGDRRDLILMQWLQAQQCA